MNTECGLVGIIGKEEINYKTVLESLIKLQHRGRESYGLSYITENDNKTIKNQTINSKTKIEIEKYYGLINEAELSNIIKTVSSKVWFGHVRYSTSGKKQNKGYNSFIDLTQPIAFTFTKYNDATFIYNGNIPITIWENIFTIYPKLKEYYNKNIALGIDINDSLLFIRLILLLKEHYTKVLNINNEYRNNNVYNTIILKNILNKVVSLLDRAFCIIIQFNNECWVIRDKYGVRPLVLGLSQNNNSIIIASENCCFNDNYRLVGDIKPGCIVKIDYKTLNIKLMSQIYSSVKKHCIFEYFYFMRKNTTVNDISVLEFRTTIGKLLFEELKKKDKLYKSLIKYNKDDKDKESKQNSIIVCGIPESGIVQAQSFAEALNASYIQIIEKNPENQQRTFILDNNKKRLDACKTKYIISTFNQKFIKDKKLILVDDSIVRGNTIKYLIKFVREYKPKEIHFMSASPPIVNICNYGVDFPDIEDLIASRKKIVDIEKELNLNSLTYLNKDTFNNINLEYNNKFCLECFNN
jgi:amidophosphoribosyltransferase